jgi:DNA-binding MarR family transcriptional regulator
LKLEDEIKQTKFTSMRQKAMLNLIFTVNWLQNKQQDFFKPFGITSQQYNILRILRGQRPSAISATEIKSRMLDKNSDVSRLLDRLIQKNLIEKKTCPSDKRATDVSITDQGMELLNSIDTEQKKMDDFTSSLTEEEAALLSDLLDKARG